jgi:WD40 repeat protein
MAIEIIKYAHLTGHAGAVYSLCRTNDANIFFSAGGDGMVIRWDMNCPDRAYLTARVQSNVFSTCMIAGRYLLLGQMQGGIHVLDLDQKKEIRNIAFHRNAVFDIQPADSDRMFFSAGGDGVLGVWRSDDFSLIKHIQISSKSIRAVIVDKPHERVYVGCSDHCIYVVDYDNLKILHRWEAHRNSVFSLCLSPCGKYLLSGSRDAHLSVWLVEENYRHLHSQPAHLFTINHIVYSPDKGFFATAGRDKHVKIWDAANFKLLKVIDKEKFDGHVNSVNRLLWNEHYLISCSDDRSLMVWKISKK